MSVKVFYNLVCINIIAHSYVIKFQQHWHSELTLCLKASHISISRFSYLCVETLYPPSKPNSPAFYKDTSLIFLFSNSVSSSKDYFFLATHSFQHTCVGVYNKPPWIIFEFLMHITSPFQTVSYWRARVISCSSL